MRILIKGILTVESRISWFEEMAEGLENWNYDKDKNKDNWKIYETRGSQWKNLIHKILAEEKDSLIKHQYSQ